jgi:hypothetical protein
MVKCLAGLRKASVFVYMKGCLWEIEISPQILSNLNPNPVIHIEERAADEDVDVIHTVWQQSSSLGIAADDTGEKNSRLHTVRYMHAPLVTTCILYFSPVSSLFKLSL